MHAPQHDSKERRGYVIPSQWVLLAFLAIAGYFLLTEHRAHVIQLLPFVLLLACPLLHLLHGGHGGHRHRNGAAHDTDDPRDERKEGERQ